MGEVVSLREANQFQPGKSQFMCGFFSVAMVASMSPPGKAPTKSVNQVIDTAVNAYAKINGDVSISDVMGMSLDDLYAVLHDLGLHYQGTVADKAHISAWINLGFPVVVAVDEFAVYDDALGRNPYPWKPSGTHVVVITGIDGSAFLVRDAANCSNLYDPNSLRPGPRRYDATKLCVNMLHATAIVPPWKSRPPAGFDPTQEKLPATPTPPQPVVAVHMVPSGWKDDGTTLFAPNGIPVVNGFRLWILKGGWDSNNWPLEKEESVEQLELSNPSLGAGSRQVFRLGQLEWQKEKNEVFVGWIGAELLAERAKRAEANPPLEINPEIRQQLQTLSTLLQPMCTAYNLIQPLIQKGK